MQVLIADPALVKKLRQMMKAQKRSGSNVVCRLIEQAKVKSS